ncbi:MAG: hypothetical protein Q4C66_07085 [Lachnospiraceae bacterium]|nr:hypothetical protein [Lachnospiraceae bacterium]
MDELSVKANEEELNGQIQLEGLTEEETKKLYAIMNRFTTAYREKAPECSDREWLIGCYHAELPEWTDEKIEELADETLDSIHEYDKNLASAETAAKQGISSERWFADKVAEASTGMAVNEFGRKLTAIDTALTNGNAQMMRAMTTKAGDINQNPKLWGFIAEQHHVNTFNAEAALKGSNLYAEVKVPGPGEVYGKNSFDVVVKDRTGGRIVQQYQVKYGETFQNTIRDLKNGNYNNQRLLVPFGQANEVQAAFPGKTVTDTIHVDGISSKPLSVEEAKALQNDLQEQGQFPTVDYNTFQTKDLALHIGKNAGMVGLQSAVVTTGFTLAANALSGEKIDSDAIIETALVTGADTTVKAAAAGALKVGAEKGIISILPPGTPARVIADIACLGIENAKILAKVATGELTMSEALDKMGRTSTAMVYGLGWGGSGALIGAAALSWVPIVGPIVGGLVGGMAGYMTGSKFGTALYNGVKKIGSAAKTAVKRAWEGVKSTGRKIAEGIGRIGSKIGSGIRSIFR